MLTVIDSCPVFYSTFWAYSQIYGLKVNHHNNDYQAGFQVNNRSPPQIFQTFYKNLRDSKFHKYIWIQHKKCTDMSTSLPLIQWF